MNFCICQMLPEKLEYNGIEYHIMVHLKKGYESIRRSNLYNILSDMELVRSIKMCLNDTHNNARIHICLICFLFMFLESSKKTWWDCNWMGYISFWSTLMRALLVTGKSVCLEAYAKKTKHISRSCQQKVGKNHNKWQLTSPTEMWQRSNTWETH
jgi:hypothetical protein